MAAGDERRKRGGSVLMAWSKRDIEQLAAAGKIKGFQMAGKPAPIQAPAGKAPKYGNQKTVIDGIEFDSKKEARRYQELKIRVMAGDIWDLKFQEEFPLIVNGITVAHYRADFTYQTGFGKVVEDVKSAITRKNPVYRLKNKLMNACHGIKITEI